MERAGQVVECWQKCWNHVGSGSHCEDFEVWGIPGGCVPGRTQSSSSVKNLLWGLLRDACMKAYRFSAHSESAGAGDG